jgi:hypothetical protein
MSDNEEDGSTFTYIITVRRLVSEGVGIAKFREAEQAQKISTESKRLQGADSGAKQIHVNVIQTKAWSTESKLRRQN